MGCDIHCYAEIFKDGRWQKVNSGFRAEGYKDPDDPKDLDGIDEPIKDRNYNLFSVLADVRNGYGAAGLRTGDSYIPISMPKGLPSDVSKEIAHESDEWDGDGHSHSWLTLQEILVYDFSLDVETVGWVDKKEYDTFKKKGKPESWRAGCSGEHITNEEMDAYKAKDGDFVHTFVSWIDKYDDNMGELFTETIPALKQLGAPDKVRIVFWFDN